MIYFEEKSRMEDFAEVEECILVDDSEEYTVECHLWDDEESPTGQSWYVTMYKSHPSGTWYEVDGACFWDYPNAVAAALGAFSSFVPFTIYTGGDYDYALDCLMA